jgi:hypothetical protein
VQFKTSKEPEESVVLGGVAAGEHGGSLSIKESYQFSSVESCGRTLN